MSDPFVLDSARTALLVMDYQHAIVALAGDQASALVPRAVAVRESARAAGSLVAYVRVGFRPGHPEVGPHSESFLGLKRANRLLLDASESQIVEALTPREDEPVVVKHRVGPFNTTALESILRARQIDTLVLLGISTSGVVLSTVRHAADFDYRVVVVEDGCVDPDPEVHRVLMEKVFPRQAEVVQSAEVIRAFSR